MKQNHLPPNRSVCQGKSLSHGQKAMGRTFPCAAQKRAHFFFKPCGQPWRSSSPAARAIGPVLAAAACLQAAGRARQAQIRFGVWGSAWTCCWLAGQRGHSQGGPPDRAWWQNTITKWAGTDKYSAFITLRWKYLPTCKRWKTLAFEHVFVLQAVRDFFHDLWVADVIKWKHYTTS